MYHLKKNINVIIVGDGNCLFRSFSYFLTGSQEQHLLFRMKIVKNVVAKWDDFKNFIIGNDYYENVCSKELYFE